MKVLVCGGRTYEDQERLFMILDAINAVRPISVIVHGDAGKFYDYPDHLVNDEHVGFWVGADKLASQWARENAVPEKFYKPDWKQYGKKGGPIRNQQMLDDQHPDIVMAFPGGRGTKDMVTRAKAGGYKVHQVGET